MYAGPLKPDLERLMGMKLFTQGSFSSGCHLMAIICIHLMIYFLESTSTPLIGILGIHGILIFARLLL